MLNFQFFNNTQFLFIELGLLAGGLYTFFAGKIPDFLMGGDRFQVSVGLARFIGVLLISPFPISWAFYVLFLSFREPEAAKEAAALVELAAIFGMAAIAWITYMIGRKPVQIEPIRLVDGTEIQLDRPAITIADRIAQDINLSLKYTILGLLPVVQFLTCPLAILHTTIALKRINRYKVGEKYRGKAQIVRAGAILVLALWIGLIIALCR